VDEPTEQVPPMDVARVEAQERCRGDEEGDPSITRDRSTRRREQDPIDGPELRSARCSPEHPELVAEDEDLEVLGAVVMVRLSSADEDPDEGAGDEVEEGPHRSIVPMDPSTNRGF
jgi:hypothetical protein